VYIEFLTISKSCSDRYIFEWLQEERDNKAGSSKENGDASSREMICKKLKFIKYDTKYLSSGFTNIDEREAQWYSMN
jgi:hypothetical protein